MRSEGAAGGWLEPGALSSLLSLLWWIPEAGADARSPSRVFQNVGCDFEIDSGAIEDRCGVCHGNGSTCHTVSEPFEESEGLGTGRRCWWEVLLTWRPLPLPVSL